MTNSKVMGPVDYLLIKFPGNKFTGKIAPELARLQKEGLIRVLDLVFMVKDQQRETSDIGGCQPARRSGRCVQ